MASLAMITTLPLPFAEMGIPSFACTPDLFPDLMAAAIQRQDLGLWAARNDIVTATKEHSITARRFLDLTCLCLTEV